jgi:membrane-associated phospholipid phosphatase
MIGFLQKTRVFSIPFYILIAGLSILLLLFDKIEIARWINAQNSESLDFFFKYLTHLGDGIVATIIALIFMLFNIKKGIILLLSFILSGLIIQFLKIHVFPEMMRPIDVFGDTQTLHMIEGVKIWSKKSFPSGHTGTAFAMFYCIAAFTDNRRLQFLAFVLAVLLGYSRLYLSQHFLPDVIAGSIIGMLISLSLLTLFERYKILASLNHSVFSTRRTYVKKIN